MYRCGSLSTTLRKQHRTPKTSTTFNHPLSDAICLRVTQHSQAAYHFGISLAHLWCTNWLYISWLGVSSNSSWPTVGLDISSHELKRVIRSLPFCGSVSAMRFSIMGKMRRLIGSLYKGLLRCGRRERIYPALLHYLSQAHLSNNTSALKSPLVTAHSSLWSKDKVRLLILP